MSRVYITSKELSGNSTIVASQMSKETYEREENNGRIRDSGYYSHCPDSSDSFRYILYLIICTDEWMHRHINTCNQSVVILFLF